MFLKIPNVIALLAGLIIINSSQAQNSLYQWVRGIGGTSTDVVNSVATDSKGNIYTTGYFQGTADFNTDAGILNLTSAGSFEVYIHKLNANGKFIWAKQLASSGYEVSKSISADPYGNLYILGSYYGTVDFDPDTGTFNMSYSNGAGMFLLKLDTNGKFKFANQIEKVSGSWGYTQEFFVTTDDSGNVYVTGNFGGTLDFDPDTSKSFIISAQGGTDIFIQKLDSTGKFIWAKTMGGSGASADPKSLAVDQSGNVFVAGDYRGTIDFDPDTSSTQVYNLSVNGASDIFVAKLDVSGNFKWAKSFGASKGDRGEAMAIDSWSNVYTTGFFQETTDFDPGAGITNLVANSGDVFIQKLDSNGNFKWAKHFGGSKFDAARGIATDKYGSIFTTGYFQTTVDFDPGPNIESKTVAGRTDIFTHKMDSAGNFIWVKQMGGASDESASSISIDPFGGIVTAGGFKKTADFDPEQTVDALVSNGNSDLFIHKLSDCQPVFVTDTVYGCDSITWIDGNTYSVSNNSARVTLLNSNGCDSIVTLNLVLHHTVNVIDTIAACDSYKWINGITYTASNFSAKDTLKTVHGCDSIVSLNLTINKSRSSVDSITSCDSYKWIDGNTYTASNSTAKYTLKTSAGCDSVVSLKLTINKSTITIDSITACKSYTWLDGKTYYHSNDTSQFVLKTTNGCDSIIKLNLTINSIDTNVTVSGAQLKSDETGATYQWLDCDNHFTAVNGATNQQFKALKNGSYAVEISKNNCTDTSICLEVTTIGMNKIQSNANFKLYPNPTTGEFQINLGETSGLTNVYITNVTGELVKSIEVQEKQTFTVAINEPVGIYFVEVVTDHKRSTFKVILK